MNRYRIRDFLIVSAISFLAQSAFLSQGACSEKEKSESYDGHAISYSTTVVKSFDAGSLGTISQYADGSYDCPPGGSIISTPGSAPSVLTSEGGTYPLTEKKK